MNLGSPLRKQQSPESPDHPEPSIQDPTQNPEPVHWKWHASAQSAVADMGAEINAVAKVDRGNPKLILVVKVFERFIRGV